ncbi:polyhydroxyalkanoate granule-associated phasin [Uliginosibacterium sp. H1]|uniref:polyhydroxyalkanoate granule-associated phasin n=1 Tax=Uliginosibacterium sp. H1 TaxID=3114757 RepID=UPI002E192081|nr:polyhydroxyalkanoate granule-associated phasin [Uliginosibacterium sp. H1]
MPSRRNARQYALTLKAAELSLAAPQVVMHRLARMAQAGANPNARDRREFTLMGAEKLAAFHESWYAMWWASWRAQQSLLLTVMRSMWMPWAGLAGSGALQRTLWRQLPGLAAGIAGKGMAPVHKRAVANARRLGRVKLP